MTWETWNRLTQKVQASRAQGDHPGCQTKGLKDAVLRERFGKVAVLWQKVTKMAGLCPKSDKKSAIYAKIRRF